MSKTIVLALGGNALGHSPLEQQKIIKKTARIIVDVVNEKYKVVVVHGNGPQVGMIVNGFAVAQANDSTCPHMPFPEAGAMSQGYIGYQLQQQIGNELVLRNFKRTVATVVTQTKVSPTDPAFSNPTKPVGRFMKRDEAVVLAKKYKYVVKEDAGRGWRQVVASPKPLGFVELPLLEQLLRTSSVLICAGGGGVPVVKNKGVYAGVPAVVDKDLAAAKIAIDLNVHALVILTTVKAVKIDFNKKTEKSLKNVDVTTLSRYAKVGQFAPGSMLPKVEAALEFVKQTQKNAFIGALANAKAVIAETSGTKVHNT